MVGDIRPYGADPSKIPQFDVLLAGFPCQPFSLAGVSKKNSLGRAHGFADEKQGNLFFDIEAILRHHRPPAFLLENVKHLQRHDKGRTFEVIRRTLEDELGYAISYRVVSSEPWVPQKRERIFIAGFRDESRFTFENFEPDGPSPKLGSILNGHNSVPEKYTLTAHLWQYLQNYKEKHASKGNGFGCSVFGPNDVTRTLSARYYKDGSEILIEQKGTRPRRLMPDECARLMGFVHHDGSEWKIPVSDTQAYKQFGNAVVVPVVKAVARHMESHILEAVARDRKKVTPFPTPKKKAAVKKKTAAKKAPNKKKAVRALYCLPPRPQSHDGWDSGARHTARARPAPGPAQRRLPLPASRQGPARKARPRVSEVSRSHLRTRMLLARARLRSFQMAVHPPGFLARQDHRQCDPGRDREE